MAAEGQALHPSDLDEGLRQVGRVLLLDRAAAEAIALLERRGIPTILLKGAAIRSWLYERHEVRPSSDVDLLVAAADFERATAALAELGYLHSLAGADPAEMGPRERDLVGPGNIWIDLHFGFLGVELPPQACFDLLWERTEDFELPGGQRVRILDLAARAMHLALHAAQNGPIDTKALADLARGLDRVDRPTWEAAAALASALQATEAFAAGLRLLPAGASLATELRLPTQMTVELALRVHSAPQDAIFFERLRSAKGARKLALIARKLYPTTAFLQANAAEPLGPRQLVAARLRHPFTVGRRLAPALLAWARAWRIARRSG
jgi:predicted nucleotidyltransferase